MKIGVIVGMAVGVSWFQHSVGRPQSTCLLRFTTPSPSQDEYKDEPGSVMTVDFYNASGMLPLSDEAIVERVMRHLGTCEPQFRGERTGGRRGKREERASLSSEVRGGAGGKREVGGVLVVCNSSFSV